MKKSLISPPIILKNPSMPEAKRFDSIAAISREAWNACFPGELEDYDYLLAVERSNINGFELCYYAVMEGDALLAATTAFFTDYDLATTADGKVRSMLLRVHRFAPKLLTLKLACLGSFATESCSIGFHPHCDELEKCTLFIQLLAFFDANAKSQNTHLLGIKDMNDVHKSYLDNIILSAGFTGVAGMPSALSPIHFSSLNEYMDSLSSATRKDMRRKLKQRDNLRIEHRRNIDDLIDEIYSMYLETKNRSNLQFEELTPEYFQEVLKLEHGFCSVYFAGDTAIAANLMLANEERLLDKFFCMKTTAGQDYNLYFISWFANIQYCLDHRLRFYQSGQAGYETKLRLGSDLLSNQMYFRHRKPLVNRLLKRVAPLLAFDVPVKN